MSRKPKDRPELRHADGTSKTGAEVLAGGVVMSNDTVRLRGGFDDDGDVAFVTGTHDPTTAYEWLRATEGVDAVTHVNVDHADKRYARATLQNGQLVFEFRDVRDGGFRIPAIFWSLP